MTCIVKNLSRRLVSYRGNSGQSWHILPNMSVELPDFEVSKNAMFSKLMERRVIGIVAVQTKRPAPSELISPRAHESLDDERGKKTRTKR